MGHPGTFHPGGEIRDRIGSCTDLPRGAQAGNKVIHGQPNRIG